MTDAAKSEALASSIAAQSRTVTLAGAEPRFVEAGPTAVLMIHGWGASAESLRFLADGAVEAGHSVCVPTLPGHGRSAQDMAKTGPSDWIASARHALVLLAERFGPVHVVGVSMGGTLALQLAALEPSLVSSVVVVNAPLELDQPRFALDLIGGPAETLLPAWPGPVFIGPPVEEITYPARSRKSGIDLLAMAALAREVLPEVKAPLLVLQSVQDRVVPSGNAEMIRMRAGSATKRVAWLYRSLHASQLDLDRDEVVRQILSFIAAPSRDA